MVMFEIALVLAGSLIGLAAGSALERIARRSEIRAITLQAHEARVALTLSAALLMAGLVQEAQDVIVRAIDRRF